MDIQAVKQKFGIIGHSASLEHALRTAVQVAPTDLSVLITGESGVGKESFSKIIHNLSARKHRGFIAVNCGAIPEGTINSELFGHAKGAFTGAMQDRKGYFETVNGGTIFLDEIGEMPLQTQQYLLRVLEQKEFMKVGSSVIETTDVRVVAATNVNLEERVRQGKFREDLYYRLNTVPIRVPALRERPEDIHLLFRKFASDFAQKYHRPVLRLDEQAQLLLERYRWPGNIRELKNVAEQISVLSEERLVDAESLLQFIPRALERHLPSLTNAQREEQAREGGTGYYEREILFKFLYDMKKDLNDLKALVAELARMNNLRMPSLLPPPSNLDNEGFVPASSDFLTDYEPHPAHHAPPLLEEQTQGSSSTPILLQTLPKQPPTRSFNEVEEIEESFSIDDMEKDLIAKALKKHRGRRKEAAKELGISERTLYRKIKQHGLDD